MMRALRCYFWTILPAFVLVPGASVPAQEAKVEVKVVKYADLADAVAKLKGKIVVVDFWATY